jgi:predicted Rossmann fold nucleotide-binding protein DprA/Smf involved in DNA uptake
MIITGTDAHGHHAHVFRPTRTPGPVWSGPPPVKRTGIERQPQARADPERPLSERHVAILELVRPEPTSALDIAKALGLTRAGVDSSLYSLSTRGLVARSPYKGWVRL